MPCQASRLPVFSLAVCRCLYSDGVSTIKNMKAFDSVLSTMIAYFTTISSINRASCEELLSPLMLPNAQFYQFLDDPKSTAWDSEELDKKLQYWLGDPHKPYRAAVKNLNKRIAMLRHKLDLNKNMQMSLGIFVTCLYSS